MTTHDAAAPNCSSRWLANLWGEVCQLALHALSNGIQQLASRVVPHHGIGIHHVGKGLGSQLEVGLVLGYPLREPADSLLGKCLQQVPDLEGVIADFG